MCLPTTKIHSVEDRALPCHDVGGSAADRKEPRARLFGLGTYISCGRLVLCKDNRNCENYERGSAVEGSFELVQSFTREEAKGERHHLAQIRRCV